MQWSDWPIVCWTLSTLLSLLGRRWIDAVWSACFAVVTLLDRLPDAAPWQVKWIFAVTGVAIVVSQVMKDYRKYKAKLAAG